MSVPVIRGTVLRRAAAGAATAALAATGLITAAAPTGAATGTPIVYRLQATASGTLDGVTFINAAVTMKQTTNTADVVDDNGEYYNITGPVTVTVTVAGVGSDTLTSGSSFVGNTGFPSGTSPAFCFHGRNSFRFCAKNAQRRTTTWTGRSAPSAARATSTPTAAAPPAAAP